MAAFFQGLSAFQSLDSRPGQGLVMEDEMSLDGAVTSAEFDDTMDIGVVGTTSGTLWYINWVERSSIRIVSSYTSKVKYKNTIQT